MAFDHSKFLTRFVEEAREHCSRISENLINLDISPGDSELINALFRSAHTIKGSSRMMKLAGVTELAHRMEDLLEAVRSGKIALLPSTANLLFRAVDALSAMLEEITTGVMSVAAPEGLCEELSRAAAQATETSQDKPYDANGTDQQPVVASPAATADIDSPDSRAATSTKKNRKTDYLRVDAVKLDELIRLMGEIVSEHGRFRRHIARLGEVERATVRHLKSVAGHLHKEAECSAEFIEIGDALQLSLHQSVRSMYAASLLQDHLVGDLQETSLKMRMQPLSTVFDPLRRTVRDLAIEHGKEIDFVVDGGDTELDRKIIDRIGDSLLHMIRNSLDHGIESSPERVLAGKPQKGTISLSAFYDSGCVTIALSDDGRGLSVENIREKALAKRLFEPDVLAGMSRAEITNIIFVPGFSTSPIITDLSGRGVGMDVVKKSIVEELRGTIAIETKEGKGTSFLLRLPPNLAVFQLFLVSVAGKTVALPATSIVEMLSAQRNEIIEIVNKKALRIREQLVPVEKLASLLKITKESDADPREALIVIIRDGEEKLGLEVGEIIGREEMVVKPLPPHMQGLKTVSGVTIGDGDSIINVLHIPELVRKARESVDSGRRPASREERRLKILVVDDSINTREIEKSILEAYGYQVDTAEDGQDALEMVSETLYDLVVSDVEMPRLDGFSLTEKLRNDDRYRHVPVIIVTSREKDEDKRRGIRAGANAYIVKGAFDQSNLLETVRSLIG